MSGPSNDTLIDDLYTLKETIHTLYIMSDGVFLLLMLVGLACVEVGSIHTKNIINLLLMKFTALFICSICFYYIGYNLAFGKGTSFFGYEFRFNKRLDFKFRAKRFYYICITSIVTSVISGSVAGRVRYPAFLFYSVLISAISFPINLRWTWHDEGILSRFGYSDLRGSGTVHVFSGVYSFVIAWIIGPRKGRFYQGRVVDMPGHSLSLVLVGGLLIVTCTIPFNMDISSFLFEKKSTGHFTLIAINTIITGSSATLLSLIFGRFWIKKGYWSFTLTVRATLAGLAATATSSIMVRPWESVIIGFLSCLSFYAWHYLVLYIRVDDVLDITAIHCGGGFVGVMVAPLFGEESFISGQPFAESISDAVMNWCGLSVIVAWASVTSVTIFGILHSVKLLRVDIDEEFEGLDITYHGTKAYDPSAWEWDEILMEH